MTKGFDVFESGFELLIAARVRWRNSGASRGGDEYLEGASSRRSIVGCLQKSIGRAILWGNAESEAVDVGLFREVLNIMGFNCFQSGLVCRRGWQL